MTVAATPRIAGPFVGTGAQADLPFGFKVFADTDVVVERDDTELVLNSDYSVTLNADQDTDPGGEVTIFAAANTLGAQVVLTSDVPITQTLSFPNQGPWSPRVVQQALDKLTIIDQQQQTEIDGFDDRISDAEEWIEDFDDNVQEAVEQAAEDAIAAAQAGISANVLAAQAAQASADARALAAALSASLSENSYNAIAALFAGFPGSAGQAVPVATRAVLKAIASPALTPHAYLYEGLREGAFVWNASNLSAYVTADPGEGFFVPPASDTTGASGAWVRKDFKVKPEFVGAGTGTDDQQALERAGRLAAVLGIPLHSDGERSYYIKSDWYLGSTSGAPAAAGTLSRFRWTGRWFFILKATHNGIIHLQDTSAKVIQLPDLVDFDIVTDADIGGGQIRITGAKYIFGGDFRKVGTSVKAATYSASGGSVLSLQAGTEFVYARSATVEYAGTSASAVFTLGANWFWIDHLRCVGGQDAFDVSGVSPLTAGREFWGALTVSGDTVNEVLDVGNAPGGVIGDVIGKNVAVGVTCKTEVSGVADVGTNRLRIARIDLDEFTDYIVRMSAGVGTTQTLHDLQIGRVDARTTTATGSTVGFLFASGDKTTDPTRGFRLGGARIRANNGTTFSFAGMVDYLIENVDSNMPTAASDSTPAGFVTERFNGVIRNCKLDGNFVGLMRGVLFENVTINGEFQITEGRHNRYRGVRVPRSQTHGWNLLWTNSNVANKDVDIENCSASNCGLGGAANQYLLNCWRNGAAQNVHGIRIKNFHMEDLQRSLAFTSGGTATPALGDYVQGNTSGARGYINKITVSSGSWAGGDAAGTLLLCDVIGEFSAAETLTLGGTQSSADVATASGASTSAPTSAGYRASNATQDHWRVEGLSVRSVAVLTHADYVCYGVNSYWGDNNRLQDPVVSVSSGSFSLTSIRVNRHITWTGTGTLTIPADAAGSTDWPIGTWIEVTNASGGAQAIAAGGSVTLTAKALGIQANGTVRIKKVAVNTWRAWGDLA